jgi:hypothetical protein
MGKQQAKKPSKPKVAPKPKAVVKAKPKPKPKPKALPKPKPQAKPQCKVAVQPKAKPQPEGEPQPAGEAAPYLPSATELALLVMTVEELLAAFKKIVPHKDFWLLDQHHCGPASRECCHCTGLPLLLHPAGLALQLCTAPCPIPRRGELPCIWCCMTVPTLTSVLLLLTLSHDSCSAGVTFFPPSLHF